MSDPVADGQTIALIVNQSPSLNAARQRFRNMEGFAISWKMAESVFEAAAARRFPEESRFLVNVAAKYVVSCLDETGPSHSRHRR